MHWAPGIPRALFIAEGNDDGSTRGARASPPAGAEVCRGAALWTFSMKPIVSNLSDLGLAGNLAPSRRRPAAGIVVALNQGQVAPLSPRRACFTTLKPVIPVN